MAIKVNKPGDVQILLWTGRCPHCGCEIECLKDDITFPDHPSASGYVQCPTPACTGHITPKPRNIGDCVTIEGPGTNTGHGHVWPRPDGYLARCGGPSTCVQCLADRERWAALSKKAPAKPVKTDKLKFKDLPLGHAFVYAPGPFRPDGTYVKVMPLSACGDFNCILIEPDKPNPRGLFMLCGDDVLVVAVQPARNQG